MPLMLSFFIIFFFADIDTPDYAVAIIRRLRHY
jgi:hypothetical protein